MPLSPEEREKLKAEKKAAARKKRAEDPEYVARRRAIDAASKARRMTDPAYAALKREKACQYAKKMRSADPERFRAKLKEYRAKNKEKVLAKQREWYREQMADPVLREQLKAKDRERGLKPEVKERVRLLKRWDTPERKARAKSYRERPEIREMIKRKDAAYYRKKKASDPAFALLRRARSRLRVIRSRTGCGTVPKCNRTRFEDYFGCSPEVLVAHIESQFSPEMTWENKGKLWHLDHIVPLIVGYGNAELLAKLNHYGNLRPLLASENIRKGDGMPDFFPEKVLFTAEEVGWSPPPVDGQGPVEVAV